MLIIPAIDLKDGKCVRLRQGRAEDVTVFGDDPAAMGLKWQAAGLSFARAWAALRAVILLVSVQPSTARRPSLASRPKAMRPG